MDLQSNTSAGNNFSSIPPQNLQNRRIHSSLDGDWDLNANSPSSRPQNLRKVRLRRSLSNSVSESSKSSESSEQQETPLDIEEFDYIHFVTSLSIKRIQTFSPEDIGTSSFDADVQGKGRSMAVNTVRCTGGDLHGQLVAVKRANHPPATAKNGVELRSGHLRWLQNLYFELQVMAHRPLCDHPNIVKLTYCQ
jgi:hypothetical protein